MENYRTDLAVEAKQLWENESGKTTKLSGVIATEKEIPYGKCELVDIINEEGEKALGKPQGRYVTLDITDLHESDRGQCIFHAKTLAQELRSCFSIEEYGPVLVVGLGNRGITPDVIGPYSLDHLLVTRHLLKLAPKEFGQYRAVSALETGVMGETGMETAEMILAVVKETKPSLVIVVDALASYSVTRMFSTIQMTNVGIVPGSGIGNNRMPVTEESLGVPVLAVGVPTVVDALTLCHDILEKHDAKDMDLSTLKNSGTNYFVTPKEVDMNVKTVSFVVGLGISLALHQDITAEEMENLVS